MARDNYLLKIYVHKAIRLAKKMRRRVNSFRLRVRWALTGAPRKSAVGSTSSSLSLLDVVVINLTERNDRLDKFAKEMEGLGISTWRRIDAVNGKQRFHNLESFFAGSIGCSLSHIDALQAAQNTEAEALLVCEDDAEFLLGREELEDIIGEFLSNPKVDILALYGRARGGAHTISSNLRIAVGLVGRVCYVVKPHMIEPLVARFKKGTKLLKKGKRRGKGDITWQALQSRKYFFATPTRLAVINGAGYSDIEGRDLGAR